MELKSISLLLLWAIASASGALDKRQFLSQHSETKEFFKLMDTSPYLESTLKLKRGTLFIPTDDAIREYRARDGRMDNITLIYHYCNIPIPLRNLDDLMITSDLQGNPPIWVTKVPTRQGTKIFLNDAQITKGNLEYDVGSGIVQIVHVVDRVLEPTAPDSPTSSDLMNPDARKFLENAASYSVTKNYGVSRYAGQVGKLGKLDIFKIPGRHTWFIPVNEAFLPSAASIGSVDSKVIDGHMIVGTSIFLRSAELERPFDTYATTAGAANFPVFVTLSKKTVEGQGETWSVSSENRIGNVASHHRKGTVHAMVLKGNIPVRNGVVHLINKPLVLIDSPILKVLQLDERTGPMTEFLDLVKTYERLSHDSEITHMLNGTQKITVFVPTSEAIQKSQKLIYAKTNATVLRDILYLHIARGEVRAENITTLPGIGNIQTSEAQTLRKDRKLYFNYVKDANSETIYVEGGGTNASIEQSDIGATNGVIHLINRVLGVEDQNMYEKIESDPMLQSTYRLTTQDAYNEHFKAPTKRFTFFAPSNIAWDKIGNKHPSEHLKLFHGSFGYQVKNIMDRHLIPGQELTVEMLRDVSQRVFNVSKYELPVRTLNGGFRVFSVQDPNYDDLTKIYASTDYRKPSTVSGDFNYVIFWDNKKSFIVRPNIKCTNGIIHIIDTVLMTQDDVYVNAGHTPTANCIMIFTALTLKFINNY